LSNCEESAIGFFVDSFLYSAIGLLAEIFKITNGNLRLLAIILFDTKSNLVFIPILRNIYGLDR
jgi:hypothetical protein